MQRNPSLRKAVCSLRVVPYNHIQMQSMQLCWSVGQERADEPQLCLVSVKLVASRSARKHPFEADV